MASFQQGWVQKKNKWYQYQKRWLKLQSDGKLKYFIDDDCKQVGGTIDCKQVTNVSTSKTYHQDWIFGFEVITPSRTFYFSSQNDETRSKWIENIRSMIKNNNNNDNNNKIHRSDRTPIYEEKFGNDDEDDSKYDENKPFIMTKTNSNERIIWYITHEKLKDNEQYKCKYSTTSSFATMREIKIEHIFSRSHPKRFAIYSMMIQLPQRDDAIFLQIFKYDKTSQKETQITHLTTFGKSDSNHLITKDNDKLLWVISNKEYVYILDSRGNEANTSIIYHKNDHMQYYTLLLNVFIPHLFREINNKYSSYFVMQSLMVIYKLLTDSKQLNWSYTTAEPVQIFIIALQSRYTFSNIDDIKQRIKSWKQMMECIISLFVILICNPSNIEMDISLQLIYEHLTDCDNLLGESIKKRLSFLNILFNDDQKLIEEVKNVFVQQIEKFHSPTKQYYYYLLWNNLMSVIPNKNKSKITAKSPTSSVYKTIIIEQNDAMHFIKLDQRLSIYKNRPYHLNIILMDEILNNFRNFSSNEAQNKLFDVMNALSDLNCLHHLLVKHEPFIHNEVIKDNDHQIWFNFVDYILMRIKNDAINKQQSLSIHTTLKMLIFNRFCKIISKIQSKQYANELIKLYEKWQNFMQCTIIQNSILENEYLIIQPKFIAICSSILKSMKSGLLRKYFEIWLDRTSISDIIDIFDEHGLDWKLLANYLLTRFENEQMKNKQNELLLEKYKNENENLIHLKLEIEKLSTDNDYKESISEISVLIQKLSKEKEEQINMNQFYEKKLKENDKLRLENETYKTKIEEYKKEIQDLNGKLKEQENILTALQYFDDEKEEDNKILPSSEHNEKFKLWLESIVKLPGYLPLFIDKQCDDIRMIEFFDEESLKEIGISNSLHYKLILKQANIWIQSHVQEGNTQYH